MPQLGSSESSAVQSSLPSRDLSRARVRVLANAKTARVHTTVCPTVPEMLLFRVMRNGSVSGTALLAELEGQLRGRLPSTWTLRLRREAREHPGPRPAAVLELGGPTGDKARVMIEYKTQILPRDVSRAVEQAKAFQGDAVMLAAPFLGRRTRELIAEQADGYADATGNLRLRLDRPALFIEVQGAESNPWREPEGPLKTLKGPGAGRVVRALSEISPPYGVRQLAKLSGASASTTTRVLALLDREALVTRDELARVVSVDWSKTIRRWAQDYSLLHSNRTSMWIEPRGLTALLNRLRDAKFTYAVTGSLAAAARGPITAPRLAIAFVADAALAAERLRLRPAESGANVMLAEPYDRIAFERTWKRESVVYAGMAQVAADLLTGPGRSPAEGDEVLRWMEANESAWRT